MTRRDWWIGIAAIVIAVLLHAAFPRYDWRVIGQGRGLTRIDRWTGGAELGTWDDQRRWIGELTPSNPQQVALAQLVGLCFYVGLLIIVLYALGRNWSSHVPPGSSRWRHGAVVAGYLLLTLFCFGGMVGALGLRAPS